jgi:hypothetical protein
MGCDDLAVLEHDDVDLAVLDDSCHGETPAAPVQDGGTSSHHD